MTFPSRWLAGVSMVVGLAVALVAQQPVRVELQTLPPRAFVQQGFDVVMRLAVDRQWLAERAVPLLQQRLDRPFHVVVPWLRDDDVQSAQPLPARAGAASVRVAVGDRVLPFALAGEQQIDGRAFELLELPCRIAALQPGTLSLPPVAVRYAFGTRFQDDFLRGRQPLDRQEGTAVGAAGSVVVEALPTPVPAGFFGAVGTFKLRATVASASGEVGVAFPCELELAGDGNCERMAVPTTVPVPGCHVQGITATRSASSCQFRLDLLPLRAGATLGPVELVAFDPLQARYVTLQAPTVPFAVAPAVAPDRLEPRVRELIAAEAERTAEGWPWGGLLGGAAAAVLTLLLLARRSTARRAAALALALAERCAAALPQDPAGALLAFDAWLAQRAGTSAGPAPDWPALGAAGVGTEVLDALQRLREQLDAARYGGAPPAGDAVRARRARARR